MHTLVYQNHKGKDIDLLHGDLHVLNIDDLFASQYEPVNQSGCIYSFSADIKRINLKLEIDGQWKSTIDELIDITTQDIRFCKKGRLIFDGHQYLPCYITTTGLQNVYFKGVYVDCEIEVITDQPYWISEKLYSYYRTEGTSVATKRYPHSYPYQYGAIRGIGEIYNLQFYPAHYRMVIYGPVINPSIIIGDINYQVWTTLSSNEFLVIDYTGEHTRTIIQYHRDGTTSNCFNKRNKESNIFAKISTGKNKVIWSGDFSFDISLINERTVPKWISS